MLTLNQIISQITNLGDNHSQIAEVGVGTFAELQASERNYPLLWIFHEQSDIEDGYFTNQIRLTVADRVITGEEGDDTEYSEQEVLSDTQYILVDFFAYFAQQHTQEYTVEKTGSFVPFTEKFNDRVAGNTVTLQIKQFYDFNKCQIPESGAAIPPSVDGLTLYDFCDADVRARLTSEQVTCLQDNICSCDPATINVNGSLWASVASGGTLNGQVHDTADADVGTIIDGTEIEIADSTNEVNGVDISEGTVAEGTHNQQIHDSGGSDVGTAANPSIVADSTVQNNATPTWTDTIEAEGTLTLTQAKALDSDGVTDLLANYIPSADGYMFTCSEGVSLLLSISDTSPVLGDTITLTATPTGITPTNYLFFAYESSTDTFHFIVEQSSGVYNWDVDVFGTWSVHVIANDGTTYVSACEEITSTSTFFLDIYSGGQDGAWSVRKVRGIYSGAIMKIRRSSDNAIKDFYPDSNDELSMTSEDGSGTDLGTWIGASNGFVHTWYDQSTSENHNVQTTASAQPKIIASGAFITKGTNSKPCIEFPNNDYFTLTSAINNTTPNDNSWFITYEKSSTSNIPIFYEGSAYTWLDYTTKQYLQSGSPATASNPANTFILINNDMVVGGNVQQFRNNSLNVSQAQSGTQQVSNFPRSSHVATIYFSEVFHFTESKLSDRTAMTDDINAFYGIY